MNRISLQKFIFYISGVLCYCSLFAGPAELPVSVSLGGVLYVQNEGKWFISHNGQLSEEIILDTLILRRPDRLNVISSELSSFGLTLKNHLVLGYATVKVNTPADVFGVVDSLLQEGYDVWFDARINFYSERRPNDFYFPPSGQYEGQWNLERIGMPAAWDITTGSPDVVVAVSDRGIDLAHPDLVGNLWTNTYEVPDNGIDDDHNGWIDDRIGWDFEWNDNNPTGVNPSGSGFPHGTNVAGVIFARNNNAQGVAGIAGGWSSQRGASMLGMRIDDRLSTALPSLIYAVKTGAHAINTSWGRVDAYPPLEDIVNFLADNYDCTFACAAGNSGLAEISIPARMAATIAVGSCDKYDHYSFDSYGPTLDVVAPSNIVTTDLSVVGGVTIAQLTYWWNEIHGVFSLDYHPYFGETSAATPAVTGTVALLLTVNPGLSPVQIRDVLRDSAEKVPGYDYNWSPSQPGHSLKMGYGRLRANNALVLAAQKPTSNLVSPQIGTNFAIGAQVPITWDRKNFTGSVRIKLYNSRGYVRTLASSLTGSSYFWTNPGDMVDGHDYRVKLESTSDPTIYDYTDRPFSLEGLAILSIPDEIFLQSLLEEGYDLNADQQIDVGEASQITTLDISQRGIKDLSGLQYFSNLQSLDCSANRITDMGPVAENQAFMSRCDKSIDFSYNLINKSSAYGVCSIACSPWLAFEADHQQSLEYCLCWDPPCGSGKQ